MDVPEMHSRLSLPLSSFIGREAELDGLRRLLDGGARLITLAGTGGVGKTRLALEFTARNANAFAAGVFFVPLQALTEPGQVLEEIAGVLGVRESGTRPLIDDLRDALADQHALLCIDNWEHVLGAAPQLADLLMACRRLHVIATSREALRLQGEHVYPVHALSVPARDDQHPLDAIQAEAVQLFVARAQAVKPSFAVDAANAAVIGEICALLDGLPLAIELAAALMRLFSPRALLARLKGSPGLAGRSPTMQMVAGGLRDLPARQQTLRGAIEWSYNLLDPSEQRLFRRLAVFAGGCDLEAAEAVCGDEAAPRPLLDSLLALVDKNLLRAAEFNGEPRFEMLRTIQEYAGEQLQANGELHEVHARHAGYYRDLAERAKEDLHSSRWIDWAERLNREHNNLRTALTWSLTQEQPLLSFRLGSALWQFWAQQGYLTEGREWLGRILAKDGEVPPHLRANVLNGAGGLALLQDDYETGTELLTECLYLRREIGDTLGIAASLHNLAMLAIRRRDFETALVHIQETLALDRASADRLGMANDFLAIGWISILKGDFAAARKEILQGLAICEELGDAVRTAQSYAMLGEVELGEENFALAYDYMTKAREVFVAAGDVTQLTSVDHGLGQIALRQQRYEEAERLFSDSLHGKAEIGDKLGMVTALEGLMCLAAARSEMSKAAQLWGACDALRRAFGTPQPENEQAFCRPYITLARNQLREKAFSSAYQAGEAMSLEQTMRFALEPSVSKEDRPVQAVVRRSYPAGLTAREVEVLVLVAQGLTDAEVAERLVLSPRTVNAHLTSVYNKLGVNTRAAATRFAVEQKLV